MVTAVGRPRATSRAKLGPERTAGVSLGAASSATCVMRLALPRSSPLAAMTTGVIGVTRRAITPSTARTDWAGTATTRRSAPTDVGELRGRRNRRVEDDPGQVFRILAPLAGSN